MALADMPRIPSEVLRAIADKLVSGAKVAAPMLPSGERGAGFQDLVLDDDVNGVATSSCGPTVGPTGRR